VGVAITTTPQPVRIHGNKVWRTWTVAEEPESVVLVVEYTCSDETRRNARITIGGGTIGPDNFELLWGWMVGKTADEVTIKIEEAGFGHLFEDAFRPNLAVTPEEDE
jgi:hypothetical protein